VITDVFFKRYPDWPSKDGYALPAVHRVIVQATQIVDDLASRSSIDAFHEGHEALVRELGVNKIASGTSFSGTCHKFLEEKFDPRKHASPFAFIRERVGLLELLLRFLEEDYRQINRARLRTGSSSSATGAAG
jgi:hypothetical protein